MEDRSPPGHIGPPSAVQDLPGASFRSSRTGTGELNDIAGRQRLPEVTSSKKP
jgi:hypothetical protein